MEGFSTGVLVRDAERVLLMASSEPAAAVLGHPEIVDVDACHDETGSLSGSTSVTHPEDGLVRLSEDEEPQYDVEDLVVIDALVNMSFTRPEIIRAVPIQNIFRGLARPLRQHGDYYHLSQVTTRIGAFWSHSWHDSMPRKIFTVFFLHKSRPRPFVAR